MPSAPAAPTSTILATAVTPWTDSYQFDEETFCRQVRTITHDLTNHIYVFGTAGEGYAVTDKQFDQIVTAFTRTMKECKGTPMVGVVSLALGTMIERIERAHAQGVREFQLSLPSWGALNDHELDVFFAETCGRFPDCNFLHYNLLRTKRRLTSVEYLRLAAAHPNLVAVKAGTNDEAIVADWLKVSPRLRFYLTEGAYAIARRTHEVGLLISLASINPKRAKRFVSGTNAERTADEAELRAMLAVLLKRAENRFHMDGAFDKLLFKVSDPSFPLRLLPPYASSSDEDYAEFMKVIPPGWRQ